MRDVAHVANCCVAPMTPSAGLLCCVTRDLELCQLIRYHITIAVLHDRRVCLRVSQASRILHDVEVSWSLQEWHTARTRRAGHMQVGVRTLSRASTAGKASLLAETSSKLLILFCVGHGTQACNCSGPPSYRCCEYFTPSSWALELGYIYTCKTGIVSQYFSLSCRVCDVRLRYAKRRVRRHLCRA